MNTTTFTSNQLRKVIPYLIKNNIGAISCSCDPVEFMPDGQIIIESAFSEGDLVTITFHQNWEDDLDGFTYYYELVQEYEVIESYLNLNE